MSELFGNNAAQMMKKNVMKEDFGWEVPVESVPLPSRGVIYSPDSTIYNRETIPIKAMTARDEDILSSQAYIKEGTVISELIKSCVTDKSFNIDDLILGDRNALMISVRITGYGADYNVISTCKNCSHKNNVTVMLSDLKINRLTINPTEEGKNEFEFTLPVTKKSVTFKFLSMRDDKDRTAEQAMLKTATGESITSFLRHSILSIDGIKDKNKIRHFVNNMPAFDSKELRKFIRENEPGMDMGANYICEKCSFNNEFEVPMSSEFFWPST